MITLLKEIVISEAEKEKDSNFVGEIIWFLEDYNGFTNSYNFYSFTN